MTGDLEMAHAAAEAEVLRLRKRCDHAFRASAHVPISCAVCGQEQRFHPDDLLTTVKAVLDDPESYHTIEDYIAYDWLRALVARVEQAEADFADMRRQRDQWKEFAFKHPEITPPVVTQELDALRARLATAEADGKAASRFCYLEGWNDVAHDRGADFNRAWAAWLASEAKKGRSDKVRSAGEVAEEVLAFRKEHRTLIRFHERAMVLDNGERGSAQKAVMFDSNDLSSLLLDMASLRAENSDLRARLATAEADNAALRIALEAETARAEYVHGLLAALRERHAADVKAAFREAWGRGSISPHEEALFEVFWIASESAATLARLEVVP